MSRIEALIFDCDGVIFDSHSANLAYYNKVLKKFSYPLVRAEDHEKARLCHTACSSDVFKGLLMKEDVQPALDYAAALDYREFIPSMILEPHIREALGELVGDYPLAIATNRGRSIEPVLEHFGLKDFFSVVVTSHDVKRPKPAPDMLLFASDRLNVEVGNCLFIGDSDLDKSAAQDAGIPFLGFGSNVETPDRLLSHADLIPFLDRRKSAQFSAGE